MIFPFLVLVLNLRLRRVMRSSNRCLAGETLLLLGISQLPFSAIKIPLFTAYALVLVFAQLFRLRVGQPLDRFAIRYAWQETRNTSQILTQELSLRNFLYLAAVLAAAWWSGFAAPVFAALWWLPPLLILAGLGLFYRCLQYHLPPALYAACEIAQSFALPDKHKKLHRAERTPLPSHGGGKDRCDVLFIVCESLSRRILESDDGRQATPRYQEFLRANSAQTFSFPMAIANSSTSDIAYATLFTGLSPDSSHKRFHSQPLVWSAARARGYHTSFYTSQSLSWLNMQDFFVDDTLDVAISRESLDAPCVNDMSMDDRLLNRRILQDWERSSASPRFCVVNYNMLHVPCLVPEESAATRKQTQYERYLLALRVFDQCFGELVDRLEKEGRLDRTAIVFTGDHGEMPRAGGYIDPEQSPDRLYRFHPDILRVPMWVRLPDDEIQSSKFSALAGNCSKAVSNLDLYPTLLELAGYPQQLLPDAPDGSSLCQPLPDKRRIIALNANELRAWQVEPFALLRKNHLLIFQDMSRQFELYDLQNPVTSNLWPHLPGEEQKRWLSRALRHPSLNRILKKRHIQHQESAHITRIAGEYNQRVNEGESTPLHQLNNWHLFSAEDWEDFCLHTARAIGVKKSDHVFEAGCGAGAFLDVLSRHYEVTMEGVDLAGNLVEIARKRLPGRFWTGDIQRMPYVPSVTYDKAISHGVFLYLPSVHAVRDAALEMVRVTKPGGTVYIGVMNDPDRFASYQSEHKPSGLAVVTRSFWTKFARENQLRLELFDQEAIYQKSTGYDAHSRLRYSVCLHLPAKN